jgi:hypothetical protein
MAASRDRKLMFSDNAPRWSLVMVAIWLSSTPSWAQAGDPAAARTLFQEALKQADAGDYVTACPKFEDSYRLDPTFGAQVNVADCEERRGHLANAWLGYQKAREMLATGDKRIPDTDHAIAELEKRLPRLTIRVAPAAPSDAMVERDGLQVAASSFGLALPVDPGHHIVVIKSPGRQPQRYEVELAEGESSELIGEPGAAQPPIAAAPPIPAPRLASVSTTDMPRAASAPMPGQPAPHSRTAAYLVGSIGLAGLAAGVVTRVLAFGKQSSIDDHCPALECDATGMDAVSAARTLQAVSTVSLLVGVAGVGTGIYLVLAGAETPAQRATLQPMFLQAGAGLALHRGF